MARPSKGDRRAIILRLPSALVDRIQAVVPRDRHDWLVAAVEAALSRDETAK